MILVYLSILWSVVLLRVESVDYLLSCILILGMVCRRLRTRAKNPRLRDVMFMCRGSAWLVSLGIGAGKVCLRVVVTWLVEVVTEQGVVVV